MKFERAYPTSYLEREVSRWSDVEKLTRAQYLDRVFGLLLGASDYYSNAFREFGWEAEEFLTGDPRFLEKVSQEIYSVRHLPHLVKSRLRAAWRYFDYPVHYIEDFVLDRKPDVLFVRGDTGIPSTVWQRFRKDTLVVGYLAAELPSNWQIKHWDALFTMTKEFKDFFEIHQVPTFYSQYAFDKRVLEHLSREPKSIDVSFVGNLHGSNRATRAAELATVAEKYSLQWWGESASGLPDSLVKQFRGISGGIEMFRTYAKSRIVLNSYSGIANGHATNQRIYEVMGCGTFLLSKCPAGGVGMFPPEVFITFQDGKDCLDKIQYFLKNEKEREEIAKAGQQYILRHCEFRSEALRLSKIFTELYEKKFGVRKQKTLKAA